MPPKSLAQKLNLKAGHRLLVLEAPEGFLRQLEPLPPFIGLDTQAQNTYDLIILFVKTSAEFALQLPVILAAVQPATLLWIAYPKGSSKIQTDLTRDRGWEPLYDRGWATVSVISLDAIWSILRFKPLKLINYAPDSSRHPDRLNHPNI